MKEGKAIKKFSLYNKLKYRKTAFREERCETIEVYEWFQDCFYYADDPVPYECGEPYPEYVGSYEHCYEDGEPGDPCLDPANFGTAECGGGGEIEVPMPVDIINNTTDTCINKTVADFLGSDKNIIGKIGDIIKKFDSDSEIKINIFDGHIFYADGSPKPGEITNQIFNGDLFSADIKLGIDFHDYTSKENLISSLIHEVVHGYLTYMGNNTLLSNNHDVIAEKYVVPMGRYLSQYFGISLEDGYALAWSGLSDSAAYNSSTSGDKEYTMTFTDENGVVITTVMTKGDIDVKSGAYKLKTNVPQNSGFTKGKGICK